MVAIAVAAGFLVAALLAALASGFGADFVSPWLPLHLALAGGASTAIAGVMPFFVAALAAGDPAPSRLRKAAVGFVAVGAALVAVRGIAPGQAWAWAPGRRAAGSTSPGCCGLRSPSGRPAGRG